MIARRLLSAVASALLVGGLFGCQAPLPPPSIPPVSLPLPPPVAPPAPETVSAKWSFAITGAACIAHAPGRDMSLELRIGANDRAELTVAGPAVRSAVAGGGREARLRFKGVGGAWTLPARSSAGRAVLAAAPLNETTASDVLVLLGGGRLQTEVGKAHVPVLRLPDSDVAGREWFDCVRSKLGHATPED